MSLPIRERRPAAAAGRLVRAVLAALVLVLAGCGATSDGDAVGAPGDSGGSDGGSDPVGEPELVEPPEGQPLPPSVTTPVPAPGRPAEMRALCFSPEEDCVERLLALVEQETEAIDVAIYHLYDSRLSRLLVAKHRAGVRVRVLADRHAYTAKASQAREMNRLAAGGVPVRTNRHRGILHHKVTLLHGLGLVEHGSMNYTAVASRKVLDPGTGRATWIDEVAFFTTTPRVFARFRERFERMWANSGGGREAFQPFTAGMTLPDFEETEAARPTTRYENPSPDPKPLPDHPELEICFAPDQNCNQEVLAPIVRRERDRLDVLMFRATDVEGFGVHLIERVREGLPVRIIFDRSQYRNELYPSMTRIIDALLAADTGGHLRLKATAHPGAMHMKSLVTPRLATWGSGNFTKPSSRRVRGLNNRFYQDEDMVIARDPALVAAMQARFDEMWEGSDFADFAPAPLSGGTGAP